MKPVTEVVGIIGAGSFGVAIADLLSENTDVLLYARRAEVVEAFEQRTGMFAGINQRVKACSDLATIADQCTLIFVMIPSISFREVMRSLSPFLRPSHLIIHGTKGLDVSLSPAGQPIDPSYIRTMSQVIEEETVVCRIGCLSGPNLSGEIRAHQPAATLISSRFKEVIKAGQKVLRSPRFQIYGNNDILGVELSGTLKNIIALAAGILGGRDLGKNVWALLITRGLSEMIHIGKAMGADVRAFLGIAGIGDLVATAASTQSRNYQVGYRVARGEKVKDVLASLTEVAEGIRTLEIAKTLITSLNIATPITEVLYRIFFKDMEVDRGIKYLMTFPYAVDVDYI
jgi:glycerol-3-phosphate dehydrogenase (NAD(P)+)